MTDPPLVAMLIFKIQLNDGFFSPCSSFATSSWHCYFSMLSAASKVSALPSFGALVSRAYSGTLMHFIHFQYEEATTPFSPSNIAGELSSTTCQYSSHLSIPFVTFSSRSAFHQRKAFSKMFVLKQKSRLGFLPYALEKERKKRHMPTKIHLASSFPWQGREEKLVLVTTAITTSTFADLNRQWRA